MIRLLSGLLVCILVIIVLLLIVKVIKLKQIINKRINGEELALEDFREFNTWKFSPFEVVERKIRKVMLFINLTDYLVINIILRNMIISQMLYEIIQPGLGRKSIR